LKELSGAFSDRRSGQHPCARVHALAKAKLDDVERRIDELARVREALRRTLATWDDRLATSRGKPAGLLDALADAPITSRAHATPRRRTAT
jgi:hypothetical protein